MIRAGVRTRLPAAAALIVAILVLDQASKAAILAWLPTFGFVELTPFFNLVLVWNRGVSFGVLSGAGDAVPFLLVGVTLLIVGLLAAWWWREPRGSTRLALLLVIAGALGNLIDRLRYGAVVDFLDLHAYGYHWPAFNVADSCIVIGAVVLLADGFVRGRREATMQRGSKE